MKTFLILFIFLTQTLFSSSAIDDSTLQKMIGHMIIIGFPNENVDKNSTIIKQINKYELGGVILFDRFYNDRSKTKNISSPSQLQELTSSLKKLSNKSLLISVDQEGGKVARLKPKYGFKEIPSAKKVALKSQNEAEEIYSTMSNMLKQNGINCNFAPVVDLEVNPRNKVIVGLERSFGKDSKEVSKYAKILIDELPAMGESNIED